MLCSRAAFSKEVSPGADYVFRHGGVYTLDPQNPWTQAVAVQGDTIVFVGSDEDSRAFVGPGTQVVDLTGMTLLPGFVDGHNHLLAPLSSPAREDLFLLLPRNGITACHVLELRSPRELEALLARFSFLPCRITGVYASEAPWEISKEAGTEKLSFWQSSSPLGRLEGVVFGPGGVPPRRVSADDEGGPDAFLALELAAAGARGYAVHLSVPGRVALSRALRVMEEGRRHSDPLPDHITLHHLPSLSAKDLRRIGCLGAGICLVAEERAPLPENARLIFLEHEPFGEVNVAFGSDLPFTDFSQTAPLVRMGRILEALGPLPEERRRTALARMLWGYTLGGAHQMALDNTIGSIEVGKHADLVVLGGAIFDTPSELLGQLPVLLTLVDGGETHRDPRLSSVPSVRRPSPGASPHYSPVR